MARLTSTFTSVILALCITATAKDCQQIQYTFAGDNVGSAGADCKVGCADSMKAAINTFDDICHSSDGWEEPTVAESSYVRQCTNSTNCDTTLASVCKCEVITTMWRAFKDDQEGDSDVYWKCDVDHIGNRLSLYTPGYLYGRGLKAIAGSKNRDVDCEP